jgi:surface antigen
MQIKTWHKVLFFGSITAFVVYLNREKLFSGARYIKNKFGDLVTAFAGKWVGVKEIGDNQAFGNDVFQAMMKSVGWKTTEQWCMYFAKAVHTEVFKNNPTELAKINKILNGSTQLSYVQAQNDKSGTYTVSDKPQKGDIQIFRNTLTGKGHAGIVTDVNSNNTVSTIEGNTSDSNIANGEYVAKKVRPSIVGTKLPNSNLVVRGYIRKLNA